MQEDEPTAFVTYEKFEKKMLDVMIGGEYKPDIDDTLRQAFLVRIDSTFVQLCHIDIQLLEGT